MFEVLIALTVQTVVLWTVTPYSPVEVHLLFGRTVSTFFLPRMWTHHFLSPNVAEFVPFYNLSYSTRYYCCRVYWKFMERGLFQRKFTEFDKSMDTWITNLNFYKNILSLNTFRSYFRTLYKIYYLRERYHWGYPDVDGRIILRWIFRKWEGVMGTGWSWLRIGTGGGHLWVRWGTFGFQKFGEFLD